MLRAGERRQVGADRFAANLAADRLQIRTTVGAVESEICSAGGCEEFSDRVAQSLEEFCVAHGRLSAAVRIDREVFADLRQGGFVGVQMSDQVAP